MTLGMRWSKWVLILPPLLAVTWAAGVVNAATMVSNFRLHGDTVNAVFRAMEPGSTCIEVFALVSGADQVVKIAPGNEVTVVKATTIQLIRRDLCTDTVLLDAEGLTESQTFRVAGDASSAKLTTSLFMLDSVSNTVDLFEIDLTWNASEKAQHVHAKEVVVLPELGLKVQSQSRGKMADAVATGTVMGFGFNFTPAPSESATIVRQNDGTLIVEKTVP
jgi:hypothetical protein